MDFEGNNVIEIRSTSDAWGPFGFDFSNSIPSGTSVSSVDVSAYEGIVRPRDTESDWDEITDFVEASPTISSNIVYIAFQYPGSDYKNSKATLVIEITLDSGAVHPFFYHYVDIK